MMTAAIFAYLLGRAIVGVVMVDLALKRFLSKRNGSLRVASAIVLLAVSLYDNRYIQPRNSCALFIDFPMGAYVLLNLPFVGAALLAVTFYPRLLKLIGGD